MKVRYYKKHLQFKRPGGTSRGVLHEKETWILTLSAEGKTGIGECGLFRGLSCDDVPHFEATLQKVCKHLENDTPIPTALLTAFPSIRMGVEMAQRSLAAEDPMVLYPSVFTQKEEGVPINGLVWMGSKEFMAEQIEAKLKAGFNCIKLKIGALKFEEEYQLLKALRNRFSEKDITIRVDANGAFTPREAYSLLERLAKLKIHSIEQPIAAGQWEEMAKLCAQTPLPIALDEELIGVQHAVDKQSLLQTIAPQYIILKPSLLGGFTASEEWIAAAEAQNIDWWITSALESNIGLNAIAQWTATLNTSLPQGLGTGQLFKNNFSSPLYIKNGYIHYAKSLPWNINL